MKQITPKMCTTLTMKDFLKRYENKKHQVIRNEAQLDTEMG